MGERRGNAEGRLRSDCCPSLLRVELTLIATNRSLGGTTRVRGAISCAPEPDNGWW